MMRVTSSFLAVAVSTFVAAAAFACPTCSEAIKDDPAGLAFYWSTLFMIAMPYTIALTVGGGLFYAYRRAARSAAAPAIDSSLWPAEGPEREGGR
jgi:hypothetical protein